MNDTNTELMSALAEIEALERIRFDPVWFAEEVLNLKGDKYYLDAWQKDLLESVADVYRHQCGEPTVVNKDGKSMITIRAMHGPGKTFGVAAVMHWFNCAFKGRIICTAPKEKQLATRLWPAFRKIATRAGRFYADPLKIDTTKITWHGDEDWCAIAETASQPENLAGYHDEYMLFIVDEASGVNEAMFPVIEGAVSTGSLVILILISNPTKNTGTFFASHNTPRVAQHYHQIHVDLSKTTRVSKDWVKRMEDKYGRNSPVVKVRCYGEFADNDEAQLIPLAWITEALGRDDVGSGMLKRLRVSVDVADGGENFTVVTGAYIYDDNSVFVLKQRQFNFPAAESPILAAEAGIAMFIELGGDAANGDDLVIDSLGVGAGAAGHAMTKNIPVITYRGGEASDDTKQWRNRRTQSYISMRDAFRDKRIGFAEDFLEAPEEEWEDFTAQMCTVRTKPGVDRVEELESKEAMKKRGVVSPDRADGTAMLFATQVPTFATQLTVTAVGTATTASQGDW